MQGLYCRMDLAQQHGADIAIFLHNLVFWVERNRANGVNFRDGRYWTYNTIEALAQRYPLWSKDQIKRIIAKCRERGLILVGEYNSDRRDRTKWYSPSDEILALYGVNLQMAKSPCQEAESPQTDGEIATALPESIPESNIPPIVPRKKKRGEPPREIMDRLETWVGEDEALRQALLDFLEQRRARGRPIVTRQALTLLLNRLDKFSGGAGAVKAAMLEEAVLKGWATVYPPKGAGTQGGGAVLDDEQVAQW